MKELLTEAVNQCEKKIQNDINMVLTESDFERLLANEIEQKLESATPQYVIHTQISYYDGSEDGRPCYRIDILLMQKDKIKTDSEHLKRKSFVYDTEAHAIEVKYLRKKDSATVVLNDFVKIEGLLKEQTTLYVVVLLEEDDVEKRNTIYGYGKQFKQRIGDANKSRLLYKVICKKNKEKKNG